MVADEIPLQDHVSVDEDDVVALAGGNGPVANGGSPESAVFVPDVAQRNGGDGGETLHHVAGTHARSVVGDQNLRRHRALPHDAFETEFERAGPVVGGDNQRNGHGMAVCGIV